MATSIDSLSIYIAGTIFILAVLIEIDIYLENKRRFGENHGKQ